jgi:hypothetical protein
MMDAEQKAGISRVTFLKEESQRKPRLGLHTPCTHALAVASHVEAAIAI